MDGMIRYGIIKTYNKPDQILLTYGENRKYVEMSDYDLLYLAGAIKTFKPKKILEIGVAAGGSSVAIMKCLQNERIKSSIYSVDLCEMLYNDNTKKVGFLAEAVLSNQDNIVHHSLLTGHTVAHYLDQIGNQIDFVLIDTVHVLPGELLDFLAVLPYLSDDATVVLHDVQLNHLGRNRKAFATRVLFDSVVAEKFFSVDDIMTGLPVNIAAFSLTNDTKRYIKDVFSALSLTWEYMPGDALLDEYRAILRNHYDDECMKLFELAISMNKATASRYKSVVASHYHSSLDVLKEKVKNTNPIYIYGCGNLGKNYYEYLRENYLSVSGIVISDDQEITRRDEKYFDIPVLRLSELRNIAKDSGFIIASMGEDKTEMENNLTKQGFYNVI